MCYQLRNTGSCPKGKDCGFSHDIKEKEPSKNQGQPALPAAAVVERLPIRLRTAEVGCAATRRRGSPSAQARIDDRTRELSSDWYSPREPTDAVIVNEGWLADTGWNTGIEEMKSRLCAMIVAFETNPGEGDEYPVLTALLCKRNGLTTMTR